MSSSRTPIITLALLVVAAAALAVNELTAPEPGTEARAAVAAGDPSASPAASSPSPSATASPTASPAAQEEGATAWPRTAQYAGVDGTRTLGVAVRVRDGRALAYLCDGLGIEVWLHGPATQPRLRLAAADGSRLEADRADGRLVGRLWVDGQWRRFSATPDAGAPTLLEAGRRALAAAS